MRVRGEDDLARLAASFNQMATSLQRQIRQLEDLSRVQRRFVSDVSHELRTPLTTVRMAADVLHEARDRLRPGGRAQRRDPAGPARPVRGPARRPAGDQPVRRRRGRARGGADRPAGRRARTSIEAMETARRVPGSSLMLLAPAVPCVAEVDARRIERILRNLVVNAIEHGEGRPIVVRVAATSEAVAVAVRDHGVGLRARGRGAWCSTGSGGPTRPGPGPPAAPAWGCRSPSRTPTCTTAGCRRGASRATAAQFRLTVPRKLGGELEGSPIPLEPMDSVRRRQPVTVGDPYRRIRTPGGVDV